MQKNRIKLTQKIKRIFEILHIWILCKFLKGRKINYVIAIGFSPWKRGFITRFYNNKKLVFVQSSRAFFTAYDIKKTGSVSCVIWGYKEKQLNIPIAQYPNLKIQRLEDGFVRSVGLGRDKQLPLSLCLDGQGTYFNASCPSDLEDLCNQFDKLDKAYNKESVVKLIANFKSLGISKYNLATKTKPKYKKNSILVLGQVEDDLSITINKNNLSSNKKLLERAIADHPQKTIFFKQHPDCLGNNPRPGYLDIDPLGPVIEVSPKISVIDAINTTDHIYTISSLGGFEALLHGREVSVFGCPFYAGWGLTNDHVTFMRRKHQLSIIELFFVAYICYPSYFNPQTGQKSDFQKVLNFISENTSDEHMKNLN